MVYRSRHYACINRCWLLLIIDNKCIYLVRESVSLRAQVDADLMLIRDALSAKQSRKI